MLDNNKNAGYVRLNELLTKMLEASRFQDKENLIKLAETFSEDSQDFLALLLEAAGVTDQDIEAYSSASADKVSSLLKTAASADQMKKEAQAQ